MPQVNGKYKPNMKAPRTPYVEELPEERAQDFRPVDRGYSMADAVAEANRCLDCKNPKCVQGCPVNINIPGFIEKIREGNFGGGLDIIREASLLPSVCGRVCPQENQCEGNCVLNNKDRAIAIGQLERFLGDNATELAHDPEIKPSNGKKVAVVGSGPSGIACAGELARNGYEVTVFEAFFTGGGVLTYGIPEFRLPKKIVKREIDGLEKLGVKFEYNSVVGRITDAKELFEEQGFDAMYLAVGAGLPKFLNVPGENLPGVFCANEYLTRVNLMKAEKFPKFDTPTKHGKNVVVFGGGNVAMDAARTALRLGADTVTLAYRRTEEEMPARKAELHHAKQEGVKYPAARLAAGVRGRRERLRLQGQARAHGAWRARRERPSPSASGRGLRVRDSVRRGRHGHRHERQPVPEARRRGRGPQQVGLHRGRRERPHVRPAHLGRR